MNIEDDGKGFDTSNGNNGLGITIMKYRAEEIGGTLKIKDVNDNDYTICVTCSIPWNSLTVD